MSVMNCSRMGCESILCDRYSHEFGYICGDCFREIILRNPKSIKLFMQTSPVEIVPIEDTEVKFTKIFSNKFKSL